MHSTDSQSVLYTGYAQCKSVFNLMKEGKHCVAKNYSTKREIKIQKINLVLLPDFQDENQKQFKSLYTLDFE